MIDSLLAALPPQPAGVEQWKCYFAPLMTGCVFILTLAPRVAAGTQSCARQTVNEPSEVTQHHSQDLRCFEVCWLKVPDRV